MLSDTCLLNNYVDDNLFGFYHTDVGMLKSKFQEGSKITLAWFNENQIKANVSLPLRCVTTDVEFSAFGYTL